jgi:hypothetical protein
MSHNSHHQSRRNYAVNSPSVPHHNNVAMSSSAMNQHESVDSRPVTRSVTKRNLQHQNDMTGTSLLVSETQIINNASGAIDAGLLPLTSNSHDMNNNEKILKLIEMRQQSQLKQPLPPQKTFQKIIINERPCNLINILERSRMGGPTIRNTINVIA